MSKPRSKMKKIRILPLSLEKLFPFSNFSGEDGDDNLKVNEAYKRLFIELIPGFIENRVQFVLAEVLEIDRKDSTSRLLVYSDLKDNERSELINEYKNIINSLKHESELIISESDAFYLASRIWCAETKGIEPSESNECEREWSFLLGEKITQTPIGLDENIDINSEVEKIDRTFRVYVEKLYSRYLKDYPYAYVILVPVFLGSMYGRKESLQKLGAVFLHFTTTKQVRQIDLRRIYSRTLLFWHYYFTSEAIDKRQSQLEESIRTKESLEYSVALFNRIKPSIDEIRDRLQEMQKPLFVLEAEMSPVRVLIFGEDTSKFFQEGPPIYILDGKQEIIPKHDWADGEMELYKTLIAGVLTKVFRLEKEIKAHGSPLWPQISGVIEDKAEASQPLFKELIQVVPNLCVRSPNEKQVKETFKIIKSWFSDSFKKESAPGLPITMLEFACRVWGCKFKNQGASTKTFWVASKPPVEIINALGILQEKQRLQELSISVGKGRSSSGKTVTTCQMIISFGLSYKEASRESDRSTPSLETLKDSLHECLEKRIRPSGNMTRFLWILSERQNLTLNGTAFTWQEGNCEISVDFMHDSGEAKGMIINSKGEINV